MARHYRKQLIPPFPEEIDRFRFGDWLSGFTDGEGCFSLQIGKRTGRYRRNFRIRCVFQIDLRADDIGALRLIQSFFGCGAISFHKPNRGEKAANFRIDRTVELLKKVVPLFLEHPLFSKKKRDFEIWKNGVELMAKVGKRSKTGQIGYCRWKPIWQPSEIQEFQALVAKLKATRRYDSGSEAPPTTEKNGDDDGFLPFS